MKHISTMCTQLGTQISTYFDEETSLYFLEIPSMHGWKFLGSQEVVIKEALALIEKHEFLFNEANIHDLEVLIESLKKDIQSEYHKECHEKSKGFLDSLKATVDFIGQNPFLKR